ncbi:inositol monophosphatase family protein [Phytomonospora sp. NPDC050363]|uniref:inositol monophosphatase family protein n=1 Tax=Phytomonospora sp. NPDC050363 TaxID=3155642 RepID=UPI0033CA6323
MTYSDDLALAHRLADLADPVSMRYYDGADLGIVIKPDGSPVTLADREVEQVLRVELATVRPDDLVIGEEFGADDGEPDGRFWIIDPIDGTSHFIGKNDAWSTLIGLQEGGRVTVGMASAPALSRRWWAATGEGAWSATEGAEPARLTVSSTATLDKSVLAMWPVAHRASAKLRPVVTALSEASALLRPTADEGGSLREATGNVHGGLMVAEGLLDGYVLLGGGPWDHAAVVPIVEAAGGRYSDLSGGSRVDAGAGVYSNGHIHDELLRVVNEALG